MKLTGLILAAATSLLIVGQAQALPMAGPGLGIDAPIVQVRGGCGFGAHRGGFGECRLNRGPRGAIRRAVTGAPRGCPPGLYRGPAGRCRR
ncbi:hypothetical protein [Methylobacterium sp. WL7]|uniref:GCG_CRPN prefix-to-repeats domain-containing protein n=1 Tax=Methylobacterium sp. WL7 TaxID=2603900 RepID=UPI0011CC2F8F|nr:hypothetical protein [Methylobacterium sp. WL7]TXN42996.1 hypothetical protein FV233_20385 [Methylobacterium sp. WL7]